MVTSSLFNVLQKCLIKRTFTLDVKKIFKLVFDALLSLGIGYNGFPRGCSDDKLPWSKVSSSSLHLKGKEEPSILIFLTPTLIFQKSKSGDPLETKYP